MGGSQADRDAIAYLEAANATALTIRQNSAGSASLTTSTRDLDGATQVFWTQQEIATELVRVAKHNAGTRPDAERLVACLRQWPGLAQPRSSSMS
jgi:hypothetical protein